MTKLDVDTRALLAGQPAAQTTEKWCHLNGEHGAHEWHGAGVRYACPGKPKEEDAEPQGFAHEFGEYPQRYPAEDVTGGALGVL